MALQAGWRGLPGGSSLAKLNPEYRGSGKTRVYCKDIITVNEILFWADKHYARTGKWPSQQSGKVYDAKDGTTWNAIDKALKKGHRGLPGSSSLSKLIREYKEGKIG